VIAPVDKPTDWVSQIAVALKKSGEIRLCIDPKPLNAVLRREHYRLPTLDDILPNLAQARFFTKVDLSSAFWQLRLNHKSSYLTTFGTPFGRFRWLRLPFGLKVSSEIFQKRLIQALDNLTGVICVADDVLIFGKTLEEHDDNLTKFFQRCVERGIHLTADKIEYRANSVTFHGHVLTANGLHVDPEKVKAIQAMPIPDDTKAIFRSNGMVNYLSRFLPKLADMMQPIRYLTHKGVSWNWGEEQQSAFNEIKRAITETPILAYFQPNQPLLIQCDSSQSGLGAVLLQQGKPIDYRSRSLSTAERNYAQIEKEMLAIVFALERFNTYTFGRRTIVHTDHKPLISIVKKPLNEVPKRLQRMILQIQKYDYELSYQPGSHMFIADTLSRAYEPVEGDTQEFEFINLLDTSSIPEHKLKELTEANEKDDVMMKLQEAIREGWPDRKEKCLPEITVFFNDRHLFSADSGLIFKGDRLVIPSNLRKDLMRQIHLGHPGTTGSIRRARELYYWPGMTSQIKDHVSRCCVCRSHDRKQQKEPMILRELPKRPWQFVAADLFEHDRKNYLIVVDYYSDFFEIEQLTSSTTSSVINRLRAQFARYGIPEILFTDNGPQFTSAEFRNFADRWSFEHRTSSPYYSQSNGKAESAVKAAKTIIIKAQRANEDPYLLLLEHRNTPTQIIDYSPVQRLQGRRTRTLLPTIADVLIPSTPDPQEISRRLCERRDSQKYQYDRTAKVLPDLQPGEEVWVECVPKQPNEWIEGVVRAKCGVRAYDVEIDGTIRRRNRIHLRKRKGLTTAVDPLPPEEASRTRSGRAYQKRDDVI
jgi:transposase InsO family protein